MTWSYKRSALVSILNWFNRAKPDPSEVDIHTQIGCHFEEFKEMAEVLGEESNLIENLEESEGFWKRDMKFYGMKAMVSNLDSRVALCDALCDQIVTALGVGYMMGFDMLGALQEVDRANWSKYDEHGNPVLDEQGKITKGPGYKAPNLEEFV